MPSSDWLILCLLPYFLYTSVRRQLLARFTFWLLQFELNQCHNPVMLMILLKVHKFYAGSTKNLKQHTVILPPLGLSKIVKDLVQHAACWLVLGSRDTSFVTQPTDGCLVTRSELKLVLRIEAEVVKLFCRIWIKQHFNSRYANILSKSFPIKNSRLGKCMHISPRKLGKEI